jgi:hypothetical protein
MAVKVRTFMNWKDDGNWVLKWEKEMKQAIREVIAEKRSAVNQAVQKSVTKGK